MPSALTSFWSMNDANGMTNLASAFGSSFRSGWSFSVRMWSFSTGVFDSSSSTESSAFRTASWKGLYFLATKMMACVVGSGFLPLAAFSFSRRKLRSALRT